MTYCRARERSGPYCLGKFIGAGHFTMQLVPRLCNVWQCDDGWMINKKDVEGSDRSVIEVLSQILSVGTKKIRKTSVRLADVQTETRTEHLPNASLRVPPSRQLANRNRFCAWGWERTGSSLNMGRGESKLRLLHPLSTCWHRYCTHGEGGC